MNPFLLTDFYKVGHYLQYPKGTTMVYSNLTPRKSRLKSVDKIVFFGLQYFMMEYLIKYFNEHFFDRKKSDVLAEYDRAIRHTLGPLPNLDHIKSLHELGYLPIEIKALPEGTLCPMRVPCLTIRNTHPDFYWVTNFLESLMSAILWQPITSATLAFEYKKLFTKYLSETIGDTSFVQWMGHDFSFRGMSSLESAITSGMGHLLSFTGTDTIPAIVALEEYYGADITKELVGASVPATEHSVMCAGTGVEGEFETFRRLIKETYPTGIVSIVSDTFNLWDVLIEFLPRLKDDILARDGKVVIRPDSGDPVKIICGDERYDRGPGGNYDELIDPGSPRTKGVYEMLWDLFGGEIVNGYKVLNPCVGAIYGDSINLQRAEEISERLIKKGFAPLMVYGIGSYTYQYNTRDTFGMAIKATYIEVKGEGIEIFKDPVTDDGTKKSAKGLLAVYKSKDGDLKLLDQCSYGEEEQGELQTVFRDGEILKKTTLQEIRDRLAL